MRRTGQQAVVTLPAEIDIGNADRITDTLLAVLNQGVTTLVADMTATTFCAVAGASALARAQRRAAANQAELRVAVRAPAVRRLLALTWVDRLVFVTDSVAAALAGDQAAGDAAAAGTEDDDPEDADPADPVDPVNPAPAAIS